MGFFKGLRGIRFKKSTFGSKCPLFLGTAFPPPPKKKIRKKLKKTIFAMGLELDNDGRVGSASDVLA